MGLPICSPASDDPGPGALGPCASGKKAGTLAGTRHEQHIQPYDSSACAHTYAAADKNCSPADKRGNEQLGDVKPPPAHCSVIR